MEPEVEDFEETRFVDHVSRRSHVSVAQHLSPILLIVDSCQNLHRINHPDCTCEASDRCRSNLQSRPSRLFHNLGVRAWNRLSLSTTHTTC